MSVALDVKFRGETHPLAELFPMLSDAEIQELADDIAANGLRQAIVLDVDGRVIDGRNRHAACELAGVAPTFTVYDGDPIAYIISANLNRRHLTQGQRAMLLARVVKFSPRKFEGKRERANAVGVSASDLSKATAVANAAPDKAAAVIAGDLSLEAAYADVKGSDAKAALEPETLPAVRADGTATRGRIVDGLFKDVTTDEIVYDPKELATDERDTAAAKPSGKRVKAKAAGIEKDRPAGLTPNAEPELTPTARNPKANDALLRDDGTWADGCQRDDGAFVDVETGNVMQTAEEAKAAEQLCRASAFRVGGKHDVAAMVDAMQAWSADPARFAAACREPGTRRDMLTLRDTVAVLSEASAALVGLIDTLKPEQLDAAEADAAD